VVAQVHDRKPNAEMTPIPARIQFWTKRVIDSNLKASKSMQPKSR
jgi:hypothetical protein